MSNNLCILPPKCQTSDLVEGGQCNPTEIKLQKRYVYNEISAGKCMAPDPTGMNHVDNSDFVNKNGKCHMHPVTYDKMHQKQTSFTRDINESICVDKSGDPHNPIKYDPNASFPYGYETCPAETEVVKCISDKDCYGRFNNYCSTNSNKFISTLNLVNSIPYQDETNNSLSDSMEDVYSTDPIIYQYRVKDENGKYGNLKFPVTQDIFNDYKNSLEDKDQKDKYRFYREEPYNPPKELYNSTPFKFSYVTNGTQTNKNDPRGIKKDFFPFFFFIKKENVINVDNAGHEVLEITEDPIKPVTESSIADFQNNRTKLLTKEDGSKIPVMEFVRENGELVPDKWTQAEIDSIKKDLSNEQEKEKEKDSNKIILIKQLLNEIKVGDIKKKLVGYMLSDQTVYKEKQQEDENNKPVFLNQYYYDFFKRLDFSALTKKDVERILESKQGVNPKEHPTPFFKEFIYRVITEKVTNSYGIELYPIESQYDYDNYVSPAKDTDVFVKKIRLSAGSVCFKSRLPTHKDDIVEGTCKCENKYTPYGVCQIKKFTTTTLKDFDIKNNKENTIPEGTGYIERSRRRKHNCESNNGIWIPYTDCVSNFDNVENLSNVENFKVIEGFNSEKKEKEPAATPKSNCDKRVIYHADGSISYM